jgi:2-polyprenyl-3-methyl-5-hydroxy-6-metoxy-1,4-benzoquinol methylase
MVANALNDEHRGGGTLLDVGCGTGNLWGYLRGRFDRYIGVDVVRYDGFPTGAEFYALDLNDRNFPVPDRLADVVAAVETIEHLENPRAFLRELVRLARPGAWVVVTTPNQLSWLSKLTLAVKNQFNAFQESSYPAHLTALLEIDLRRIAVECALTDVTIRYSTSGRIPGTSWHFPRFLSRCFPRAFSDNVLLLARKPSG